MAIEKFALPAKMCSTGELLFPFLIFHSLIRLRVALNQATWEGFRNQNRNRLIQQAWIRFPKAIDQMVQQDGWIFLQEDQTYIAIKPVNGYSIDSSEFPDFYVLKSSGAVNAIISDIATVDQFRSFSEFRSAVLAASLAVNLNTTTPTVSYQSVAGDTITAQWNQPNYQAYQFSSWPTAIVNGKLQAPDPDFIAGQAVIKSDPLTLSSRILNVDIPSGGFEINWQNPIPVFTGSLIDTPSKNIDVVPPVVSDPVADVFEESQPMPVVDAKPLVVPSTPPRQSVPAPSSTTLNPGIESRASWMINTYKNLTIGAPNAPNGAEAQKFGWADTLTRLWLNPNDRAPIQRFVELFKNCNFNNAFMPAGAGWILTQYWDKFTENERNSIILPVLRNANLLSHGTENYFLIRYVGAHLFSQLWPKENQWIDSIRRRRITSSELAQFTKTKLLETLRSYYSKGYTEHLSPNYLPVHFYALQALYTKEALSNKGLSGS